VNRWKRQLIAGYPRAGRPSSCSAERFDIAPVQDIKRVLIIVKLLISNIYIKPGIPITFRTVEAGSHVSRWQPLCRQLQCLNYAHRVWCDHSRTISIWFLSLKVKVWSRSWPTWRVQVLFIQHLIQRGPSVVPVHVMDQWRHLDQMPPRNNQCNNEPSCMMSGSVELIDRASLVEVLVPQLIWPRYVNFDHQSDNFRI